MVHGGNDLTCEGTVVRGHYSLHEGRLDDDVVSPPQNQLQR